MTTAQDGGKVDRLTHRPTLPPGIAPGSHFKAVPLQAWNSPEGYRKLRFPHYVTTAQDGGKIDRLTHRPPLPPGIAPGSHFS